MAASIEGEGGGEARRRGRRRGRGGEEGRLKEDPLVAALVPDPSAGPPDTTVLHGCRPAST